jgi:hypothetical protein
MSGVGTNRTNRAGQLMSVVLDRKWLAEGQTNANDPEWSITGRNPMQRLTSRPSRREPVFWGD